MPDRFSAELNLLGAYSGILHFAGENPSEIDEVTKELEHQRLQNTLDMELNDLNKRLEQKEVFVLSLMAPASLAWTLS